VVVCCEYGDKSSDAGAMELVGRLERNWNNIKVTPILASEFFSFHSLHKLNYTF
jgi:hypothetical protein